MGIMHYPSKARESGLIIQRRGCLGTSLAAAVAALVLVIACLSSVCRAQPRPEKSSVGVADPPDLEWSDFVRQTTAAGCITTNCDALSTFYSVKTGSCFHKGGGRGRNVCCKPAVLIATRKTDCPSCERLWGQLGHTYTAEMALLAEHVTFVNGGDPMMDSLTRFPYPLPLPFTQQQLLATERFNVVAAQDARAAKAPDSTRRGSPLPMIHLRVVDTPNASLEEELQARAALTPEAREDLLAHETALRRRVSYAAARPPLLQSHRWEPHLRRAFAGQGDYIFRAVFVFPHNGSVMRDVLNEAVTEGVDDSVHFFSSVDPFLSAVKKSIRVFDYVMRQEVLNHCP